MKNLVITILLFCLKQVNSQNLQSRVKIVHDPSTLEINNGDSSYIFNAYVISKQIDGISNINLLFKNYSINNQFVTEKDTTYSWSQISVPGNLNQRYYASKSNSNIIKICLGRFVPSQRQRFTFNITGSNNTLIKEFNF